MFKFSLLCLSLLVSATAYTDAAACSDVIACEHQTLTIHCDPGNFIDVQWAMYGRDRGPYVCPSSSIQTTWGCQSGNSLPKVWDACQGRTSCDIQASNGIFGDPCQGTYKFLRVEYTCATYKRARACEGRSLYIHCPAGQHLSIIDAAYGRNAGREVCPSSNIQHFSGCRSSISFTKVHNACRGRNACQVPASNGAFGDPCRGTHKYLEVKYRCS